jgi:hypothetical protein
VPNCDWHRYGGDRQGIGFVAARYRERYGKVWDEFVQLARGEPLTTGDGAMRYVYPLTSRVWTATTGVMASYRFTRLCFKADVIEPLGPDDVFEVVTPVGRFQMTKREFYRVFPNVVASTSYRQGRMYHYSKLPEKALAYKVSD